ncbi:MAG: metallophosphoesterase [Chitinophagales bacterium]
MRKLFILIQIFMVIAIFFLVYALIEYYGWQAIKVAFSNANPRTVNWLYWGFTAGLLLLFMLYRPFLFKVMPRSITAYFSTVFVVVLFSKLIIALFLLPEDVTRIFKFGISKLSSAPAAGGISRSQFLSRMALTVAAVPAATLLYGVFVNAYNYRFHRVKVVLPNLPDAFDGFRIIQLSDIHSGSFTKTEPIVEVIKQINEKNADLILFTGDLVNNVADEMNDFIDVFKELRSKHGVMSVTGNHDYGDYIAWDTAEAKKANFAKFMGVHKQLGWDLLMNEHRILERDGQKLAIIGIENAGSGKHENGEKGRFRDYSDMPKALNGTEDVPVKILMSHDPSHWDREVRPVYPQIDLMLSGHTHGAQFGVESKWLKWSPSEYLYKQWAGLYQEGKQFLYVNRGFGFLFYPGRVGILPEVTEITLAKA